MILGIGTDLVSVGRIESLMQNFGDKFSEKIFTKNEIAKAKEKNNFTLEVLFYAKRFAAKEAFAKAIGLGIGRGVDFKDIEIENDNFGKPSIKILNNKSDFIKSHLKTDNFAIHLSLTDENPLALATVIISS